MLGDDVVPDGADADLAGDPVDVVRVEVVVADPVAQAVFDLAARPGDGLVEQVVEVDAGAPAGRHLALGEVDVGVEHLIEGVGVVAQELQRGADLLGLEAVVLAQHRHRAVEIVEFPLVVGEVPRRVEAGPVAPEEDEVLLDALRREVQLPGVLLVDGLLEGLEVGDDLVGRPVADKLRLLDEPVELGGKPVERGAHAREDGVDDLAHALVGGLLAGFEALHDRLDLGFGGLDGVGVALLEELVALAVVAHQVVVGLIPLGLGEVRLVEGLVGPGEHRQLAAGVVDVVVGLDVVARKGEHAGQRVADDRVAGAADVDRPGRVRAGVFDDDAGVGRREAPVVGLAGGSREGLADVPIGWHEVDVRSLWFDGGDVVDVGGVEGLGEFGGDLRWGRAGLGGEAVGHAGGQDGVDVRGGVFEPEVVGGVVPRRQGLAKGRFDRVSQGEEHGGSSEAGG